MNEFIQRLNKTFFFGGASRQILKSITLVGKSISGVFLAFFLVAELPPERGDDDCCFYYLEQ